MFHCTHFCFQDWWWKARLGKCYHKLGLFRDAEKQFKSAIKDQDMILTNLELVKVGFRQLIEYFPCWLQARIANGYTSNVPVCTCSTLEAQ